MRKLSLFVIMVIVVSLVFTASCVSKEVPVTETYYETQYKTEYRTETYTEAEEVVVHISEGKTYLAPIRKWQTGLYFKAVGRDIRMTYYYGYEIDTSKHTRSQVKISVLPGVLDMKGHVGVYDLTGVGQIPNKPEELDRGGETNPETLEYKPTPKEQAWLDHLNAVLTNPERVLVFQLMGTGLGGEISFDTKGIKEFAILANTWHVLPIYSVQLIWSDDIIEKRTVTKERQVPYEVPVQVEKQRTVMKTKKVPIWEVIFGE